MCKAKVYDRETGKEWEKEFDSVYLLRRFLLRCKRSKKLYVISFSCSNEEEYEVVADL